MGRIPIHTNTICLHVYAICQPCFVLSIGPLNQLYAKRLIHICEDKQRYKTTNLSATFCDKRWVAAIITLIREPQGKQTNKRKSSQPTKQNGYAFQAWTAEGDSRPIQSSPLTP